MLSACLQAEAAAEPHQEAVAVVKKKHARNRDALVVMRLEEYKKWRL